MKKKNYVLTLILAVGLCVGCGKSGNAVSDQSTENIVSVENTGSETVNGSQGAETLGSKNKMGDADDWDDMIEIDFENDYTEDIKADVSYMVSHSESLQKELKNIEKITEKYTVLSKKAETQGEMNLSSRWLYVIWDTELNNLWSRFSSLADQETKERVLEEQRNWIAMKEEAVLLSIGTSEENGSMYPLLENSFLEEITKNRAYILAREVAKLRGEEVLMPEKSETYGLFVDNEGTGDVYSSMDLRQGIDGTDEAVISIYRLGELEGIFEDHGNGELEFTSDDGSVSGMINIHGWDGAGFRITKVDGNSPFSEGEEFEFPFVF